MNVVYLSRRRWLWCMAALLLTLTTPAPVLAVCSVGDTIGVCTGPIGYEGCCTAANVVQWCEDGSLCELTCGGASSDGCVPNDLSCCGYCGTPGPSICYCDDLCEGFGDCCADYTALCTGGLGGIDAPYCG